MPWTAEDASKHKSGLSAKQAAKWASVANAVLRACKSEDGKDCDARAIRIANSRVGDRKGGQDRG